MCWSMKASSLACSSVQRSEYSKSMVYPLKWCAAGVGPAQLRHRAGLLAVFEGLGGRRRAVDIAFHDALHDAGKAEHIECQVEVKVFRADGLAGALAVAVDIGLLTRNAERCQVQALD